MHTPRATIDFETKSEVSLRKSGVWRYSVDKSTDILCLAFRLPGWEAGRTGLWHPGFPSLGIPRSGVDSDVWELFDWIEGHGVIEAHNAWFERCLWGNILGPRYGFPEIAHDRWMCSAAKAASHALPRGLDDALAALGLDIRKDQPGGKVMQRMSKPRRSRKKEREEWDEQGIEHPTVFHLDRDSLDKLFAYCRQDVLAEEALSRAIPDLSAAEQQVYLLDQLINQRGFQIDPVSVQRALTLISSETHRLNTQLSQITAGSVGKATQRAQLLRWLHGQGLSIEDTSKETITGLLAENSSVSLTPTVSSALRILQQLGKSSTAKYTSMALQMDPQDHRIRGGLLYHGASTGRWSGSGVQPQNFPKGRLKSSMEETWAGLLRGEPCENVMEVLSSALRGAITAGPGKLLFVADYAGIEARVLLWLADDQEGLEIFRQGRDIYLDMAESIYGRPLTKADNPKERDLGKVAILGLGYQMGWVKFIDTALAMGGVVIDDLLSQQTVEAYRRKYWRVKEMWWNQQEAAIRAVSFRGQKVSCGKVSWEMPKKGRFLYCTLPSGRKLAYPDAEVTPKMTPWGEIRPTLTYMGINPFNRKWQRQTSYGGLLVENITQACSRDLMAEALLRCEENGYPAVLSVHDEIISEAESGDVKEFEALVACLPKWAEGCPVKAEGWKGLRYRK